MPEPFTPTPTEIDVLRQLRGLTTAEYEQVLILVSSFKRGLDVPPDHPAFAT